MPKINREEYEVLKGLDDKWIVRDKHSANVDVCREKTNKREGDGRWSNSGEIGYRASGNWIPRI